MSGQGKCRRCLLRDMPDQQTYYESVIRYRASLSQAQRTPDGVYEGRLETCKECGDLNNGTCMQCGCCVDIRAARIDLRCPMGQWK